MTSKQKDMFVPGAAISRSLSYVLLSLCFYFVRQIRPQAWYDIHYGDDLFAPDYNCVKALFFIGSGIMYLFGVCALYPLIGQLKLIKILRAFAVIQIVYDVVTPYIIPIITNDPFKLKIGEWLFYVAAIYYNVFYMHKKKPNRS